MDSKQLYIASKYLSGVLTWEKDWIHFGTGNDIKRQLISDEIKYFLHSDQIHLIQGRSNSVTIEKADCIQMIDELLGRVSFSVWSKEMDRAILFNHIGVFRKGEKI